MYVIKEFFQTVYDNAPPSKLMGGAVCTPAGKILYFWRHKTHLYSVSS
jgi:hypothetical protein